MLDPDYKRTDSLDLDEAIEILSRSQDPVERMLAQHTMDRVNKRRREEMAAAAEARKHVHDPPTTAQERQAGQQGERL